jgi:hypothetical protein
MNMPGDDIHVGVDDRNERLVHIGFGNAGGAQQSAMGSFFVTFLDGIGTHGYHFPFSSFRRRCQAKDWGWVQKESRLWLGGSLVLLSGVLSDFHLGHPNHELILNNKDHKKDDQQEDR